VAVFLCGKLNFLSLILAVMKNFLFAFIISVLVISCQSKQKSTKSKTQILPDRTLTVQFYPYWGGSAEGVLERKNGKTSLYSSYHEKIRGVDTIVTSNTAIEKIMGDSVFAVAEKVKWNADANYGTASGHEGLKVFISLKKGKNEQTVEWGKLKSVNDLPPDLFNLVQLVNEISPADFKLF
jgi:hypothetical protein